MYNANLLKYYLEKTAGIPLLSKKQFILSVQITACFRYHMFKDRE